MHLVKLGGSVITDKSRAKSLRADVLDRLASEISESDRQVMLVHGAGSFGHILAEEGRLSDGFVGKWQFEYFSKVQRDVRELDMHVLNSLMDAGLLPVSIPPSTISIYEDGEMKKFSPELFALYASLGMTPVSFGDVVLDSRRMFSICSGDHIMHALSTLEEVEKAVFVTDVDGVYDRPPSEEGARLLEYVGPDTEFSSKLANPDVTGGMAEKIRYGMKMAENGVEVLIVNGLVRGRLRKALAGEAVTGTRIGVKK